MTGKEAILNALHSTQYVLGMYLGDLSDADFLVRPVPGANHIAWQFGHLITAEPGLLKNFLEAAYPALPAGFAELHGPKNAGNEGAQGYLTKAEYLDLFTRTRNATIAAVEKLTDADLDKPTSGPMATFAPTLGAMLILTSNHVLMHAGQFTVVRRKLGKPVVF